ncbi:MAG: signal transduction histidine kinase/ActR/RegA family two-component response regulator [Flavobacteriales bacterium]|jgi:signal transduction histidine kinase/ActR/RegA family two-component response regulator
MKTKYLLLAVSILGAFLSANAQSFSKVEQDSLMGIWNDQSQADTTRLHAIHRIALEGFRFKNPDSAFYYAQEQYDFAIKVKNKEFQVHALNVQGDAYLLQGDPGKAMDVLSTALAISEEIGNKKAEINTLGNIARVFKAKGEVEKVLEYHVQILKLSEEIGDTESIGKSLTAIGENYVMKGDFPKGFEYLNRSKKTFEELNSTYNVVKVQSSMAQIYLRQGNLDEALALILLNLAYFEEIGNKTLMSGALSNLGGIYASQGNNKKALEYLERALGFFEESGNIPYIAGLSQNMARMYFDEGNLESALEYATKGLKLSREIKNENHIAAAKDVIGLILMAQGKHTEGIAISKEALIFHQNTKDISNIRVSSGNLQRSYKAIGSYKKALEMNELFHQMGDSLNSKENQRALIEVQVQADYDKKKVIDDIENENEIAIATQKIDAQRNISIAIGVALFLISVLAYVIFNRLKVARQQKAIIEEQKKKVEQSEKYKEQFLANMSHEIRTPMHAISGMTKILKRSDHPQTQDIYLNAMQTSSDNLVVILNDVLDLSKIEAGKLEIESIPVNPRQVIANVIQILKYKAEEKGLTLSHQVVDDVPTLVMGDPTRLNQILINLLGNAIKFTEKGTVNISLYVENEQLQFHVSDTGIGIPENAKSTIFEAFEQAKESTTRYYGGTGLGLSISQQLVELQHGRIWLESTEGTGSTFYVALPLIIADTNAVGANLISEEALITMAKSLDGIRILIAEDNPFNQMIAQDDLSYYINNITIDTVENGFLAVEQFTTNTYDVILMDVQMPEMNGFEATKRIREIENKEARIVNIPIIAMTASLLKTEIDSCYDAGMDNYIPKPYTLEELITPIFKELRP